MKKIVLTGGGTAGHVMPNIALLKYLEKEFDEIHYLGSKNGIEKKIISKYCNITYHEIPTVKLIRSLTPKNLLLPFKLIKSIIETKKILKKISPSVIFSKGGFVSVPVAICGAKLKIPIIAHESDSSIGLANKIILKKCNKMCFSFENLAKKYKEKGIYTGSPIREEIFHGNKTRIIKEFKLDPNNQTLLIMGGSLGAMAINNVVFELSKELSKRFNILHIVGRGKINEELQKINNYKQIEFSDNIEDLLATADYIISRSGSNSIFEFLALKKPMILIPLPKSCSRGDQIINAQIFHDKGFAHVLYQEKLNKETLLNSINYIIQNKNYYINNMKKGFKENANQLIINEIKKVAK